MTGRSDSPGRTETPLAESWRLLMGLVLDQRMRWSEVAAELGVSQAGVRALLAIDPDHPRPQRELAKAMNCDPSYVTGIVDDLEQAGFAVRRTDPSDRRRKTIALTATGLDALRTATDGLFSPPGQFSLLPSEDQLELARILRNAVSGTAPAPERSRASR